MICDDKSMALRLINHDALGSTDEWDTVDDSSAGGVKYNDPSCHGADEEVACVLINSQACRLDANVNRAQHGTTPCIQHRKGRPRNTRRTEHILIHEYSASPFRHDGSECVVAHGGCVHHSPARCIEHAHGATITVHDESVADARVYRNSHRILADDSSAQDRLNTGTVGYRQRDASQHCQKGDCQHGSSYDYS